MTNCISLWLTHQSKHAFFPSSVKMLVRVALGFLKYLKPENGGPVFFPHLVKKKKVRRIDLHKGQNPTIIAAALMHLSVCPNCAYLCVHPGVLSWTENVSRTRERTWSVSLCSDCPGSSRHWQVFVITSKWAPGAHRHKGFEGIQITWPHLVCLQVYLAYNLGTLLFRIGDSINSGVQ